jgi:hypothetical protein
VQGRSRRGCLYCVPTSGCPRSARLADRRRCRISRFRQKRMRRHAAPFLPAVHFASLLGPARNIQINRIVRKAAPPREQASSRHR